VGLAVLYVIALQPYNVLERVTNSLFLELLLLGDWLCRSLRSSFLGQQIYFYFAIVDFTIRFNGHANNARNWGMQ